MRKIFAGISFGDFTLENLNNGCSAENVYFRPQNSKRHKIDI
jgi:hypothetical protein